ncbi:MAG TPA: hypothetical protein VK507_09855 [Iamia sp.]|nr:hypothetical protein [Iamia sp.]
MATWMVAVFLTGMMSMAILGFATRNLDDPREVTGWARAHGVELTAGNIGLVRYFVRLVVVLRVTGGLGGMLIGHLFDDAVDWETAVGGGSWVWAVVGWMVGAWWADRCVAQPAGPGAGALLAARRLADYLPWYLRVAPALGALLAVGLAVMGIVDPADGVMPHRRILVGLAAAAVAIAGLAALAQHAVVARPQPARAADLLQADDAVRANAVHHLGGGATAATLLVAAGLLDRDELGGPGGTTAMLSFLALVAALVAWRFLAFRAFRVRRPAGPGGVPVGAAR